MTETTIKNAVIYCRVSTKEQVEEGNSLVSQERLCREYAINNGYEIVETFIEKGESAKTADRKELQRMITLCTSKKEAVHAVIAYKVDRISRNIADYSLIKVRLKKYNIVIKSVTELFEDTPAGRFMENIIANVGQFDNEVRTERSVGGMRQATIEGRYVWKAPIGFTNEKIEGKSTIKPNKYAPLVKETFELIAQRRCSTEEVRLEMINKGLVNNKGNPVHHSHFFLLLRNPLYKGKIKKFGKTFQGTFESIVEEELFDRVQNILKGRRFNAKFYIHDNPDFPLRRFVIDEDGKQLTGYWSKGRRLKYPYYSFTKTKSTIRKEVLEDKFMNFLNKYVFDTQNLNELRKHLVTQFHNKTKNQQSGKENIQKRVEAINNEIDNLIKLERDGSISTNILKNRIDKLDIELEDLKALLSQNENKKINIPHLLEFAEKVLTRPSLLWQTSDPEIKRKLQRFEFPEGVIFNGAVFRTTKVCSLFKLKELFDVEKSTRVPSKYRGKNTVLKTTLPPSEINLLNTKEFWIAVANEIKELKAILHDSPTEQLKKAS